MLIDPWEVVSGVFTLIFLLAAFYFAAVAGVREYGKRGRLVLFAIVLIGPGFLLDLVSEVYEYEPAEVASHGLVIAAGVFFGLSFYLSKKELEKEGGAPE